VILNLIEHADPFEKLYELADLFEKFYEIAKPFEELYELADPWIRSLLFVIHSRIIIDLQTV